MIQDCRSWTQMTCLMCRRLVAAKLSYTQRPTAEVLCRWLSRLLVLWQPLRVALW